MEIPSLVRGAVARLPLIGRGSAPSEEPTAWRLRPSGDAAFRDQLIERSIIAMDAGEVGDLTQPPSTTTLKARLAKALPDRSASGIATLAGYWTAFRTTMAVGDVVVVVGQGTTVGVAEVIGDYEYRKGERDKRLRHTRTVRWLTTDLSREELPDDLRRSIGAPGTLGRITPPDATRRLLRAAT